MKSARLLTLFLLVILSSCASTPKPSLAGDWAGTLNIGGGSLRLIFHITEEDAAYKVFIESVDQGNVMIPTELAVNEEELTFTVDNLNVKYVARMQGNQIQCTFTQFGNTVEGFTIARSN